MISKWHKVFLYLSISIGFLYHGRWNLSSTGQAWHMGERHPVWLAFVIGWFEILASLGIFIERLRLIFLSGLIVLMLGAIFYHLPQGFSFKNNGFETPLLYLMICGYLFFEDFPGLKVKDSKI